MKTISKFLSVIALSTLLVGCGTNNKASTSGENNYSTSEESSSSSSSSEEKQELTGVDKTIADFLNGTGVSIPSLNAYNMDTEFWYYAYYEQYVLSLSVATTEALDEQYNNIVKNSNLINWNDEEYTVEEYGYIYVDSTTSPKIQMYFYVEENVFYVSIYREDGKAGTADVSGVDTSWYVDYLRFSGFEKGETFPGTAINEFLLTNVEIPAPTASYFVYGGVEAYIDENGEAVPDTYYVFTSGDTASEYIKLFNNNDNFVVFESEDYFGDAVYDIYDKDLNVVFSFGEGYENTQIEFNKFFDVYTDQKTHNTDWTDAEKKTMNDNLGEVLPFIALGDGYAVDVDSFSALGTEEYWVSISDNYYQNLLEDYVEVLKQNGFKESVDSYGDVYYVKDNRQHYLEVALSFDRGNQITVYYEDSQYVAATKVELAFDEIDVAAGYDKLELDPVLTPSNASSVVTYESDSEYATITAAGVVSIDEATPAGTVINITATAEEGVTDTCIINVKENKVTSGILNCTSLELAPGESFTIEVLEPLPLGVTADYFCGYSQVSPQSTCIHIDGSGNVTVDANAEIGSTATVYVQFYPGEGQKVFVPVTVVAPSETDVLTSETFGCTGSKTYDNHTSTGSKGTYSTYCSGGNSSIQIRSKDTPRSGLIGSNNDKVCKSISITFEEHTSAERTVDIYASNEAFTIDNMYDKSLTKVGSLVYDGENATMTYNFEADYKYIGLRSNSGAIYMSSVQIIWR